MAQDRLPQRPGWTTINTVSTTCGACKKQINFGEVLYWRIRPGSLEEPDSRIVRTDRRCGECVEKEEENGKLA